MRAYALLMVCVLAVNGREITGPPAQAEVTGRWHGRFQTWRSDADSGRLVLNMQIDNLTTGRGRTSISPKSEGYDALPISRLVQFRIHGVSAAYIAELRAEGLKDISADELVEMRIHGRRHRGWRP